MEGRRLKRLLHIGCGSQPLPDWLPHFEEVRVDINPECKPHFVRNMLNLHDIGTFEVIYSSHCLEHLYPHEVPRALAEFSRVLDPHGALILVVPDLEGIRPDTQPLIGSEFGPLCGLDLFYGCHSQIEVNPHMAHHSGFIAPVLKAVMEAAGFEKVQTQRLKNFNLCATGEKAA